MLEKFCGSAGWARHLLLLAGLMLAVQSLAEVSTSVKVADASCAKCHANIYKRYLATPMANASGSASERPHASSTVHSAAGVEYTFLPDANRGNSSLRRSQGAQSSTMSLDYFLGSGHLGTTYLYAADGFLFESPIAWYAASGDFDMKPGLAKLQHPVPALPMQSGCLRCHMSDVRPSDTGTINRYGASAFLHTGVTCESCHGDSAAHVAAGGRAGVVNPAKLSAVKRDSICINCHLEGDVLVERAGRSTLGFVPGWSITDLAAYFVYRGSGATARAVSEVEQFAQSRCKQSSGEKMSCTSCHDPHFTPGAAERVAFFRGKCLTCHSEPEFAKSHHPENKDCVSCHMKQTGAENIPHVAWTDHRILRVPESTKDSVRSKSSELVALFPESASKRDMAMAYYKAMLAGNSALEPMAWAQLNSVRVEIENDPEALDALGVLMAKRGEEQTSVEIFKKVLALDAANLTALSNLGTLMAKQGKLDDSLRLLNAAFSRNQDLPGLALNLARVDCIAGDSDAATKTLKTALLYNPGLESLEKLSSQVLHCPITDVR